MTGTRHLPSASALLALAVLLLAMMSYQGGAALAESLFPQVGAEGATTYRLVLSALLLLPTRPWRALRRAGNRRALCGYGLVMGAMNLCFYMALRTVPLGLAVALEFTGPLTLAVLSSRRWLDALWIALAAAGLALLLPLRRHLPTLDPIGTVYALGAGVGWALYIVLGQKAGADYGRHAPTLGIAIGALLVLPFGVAHAGAALFDTSLLPYALGVAVLSSALPYSLEMVALTRLPARTFSTLLSLEPALGALAGALFLHQHLRLLQWLAIVAVIVAAAGATMNMRRPVSVEPSN